MKLYKTRNVNILVHEDDYYVIDMDWNQLINRDNLFKYLEGSLTDIVHIKADDAVKIIQDEIVAPIGDQEVWAAGVTYLRSMEARMEESKASGGADLYDKVYHADRPELFFKSLPHRVAGPNGVVNIRKDSKWDVPEPELTLFINSAGAIQAYTAGNDMSSRSIEGENALYLPQAKIYERSAALGPCLHILNGPISPETLIEMTIRRNSEKVYQDSVRFERMKRSPEELAGYLFRECHFEYGAFLMTGTCLVPPDTFTLAVGDEVDILVDGVGTLTNSIGYIDKDQILSAI